MARSIRVEKVRRIRASPQRVFQLLSRVESLPRYSDLWLAADVLERSSHQLIAEFRGYFGGLPVESVQRVHIRPPARLEFQQLRGTLKALRLEYIVEPEGSESRLTARFEVEAGIAMLDETAVRTVISNAVDRMLAKVKDAAERDLPRLILRRPSATAATTATGTLATRPSGNGAGDAVTSAPDVADETPEQVDAGAPSEASAERVLDTKPREVRSAGAPKAERHPSRRRRRRRRRRRGPSGPGPRPSGPPRGPGPA
jgi:ribosome-associated toxin RatA of RatAB toxin-antitoxin module